MFRWSLRNIIHKNHGLSLVKMRLVKFVCDEKWCARNRCFRKGFELLKGFGLNKNIRHACVMEFTLISCIPRMKMGLS